MQKDALVVFHDVLTKSAFFSNYTSSTKQEKISKPISKASLEANDDIKSNVRGPKVFNPFMKIAFREKRRLGLI